MASIKNSAVSKAQAAAKAVAKGTAAKAGRKVHTRTGFKLPKTLKLARNPKYARRAVTTRVNKMDCHAILKFPLNTEAAMRQVEHFNTVVFVCDVRATKPQIKAALKELYDVDSIHVNTLIRPDGQKKAFIRLAPEVDAMDVAGKIGFV